MYEPDHGQFNMSQFDIDSGPGFSYEFFFTWNGGSYPTIDFVCATANITDWNDRKESQGAIQGPLLRMRYQEPKCFQEDFGLNISMPASTSEASGVSSESSYKGDWSQAREWKTPGCRTQVCDWTLEAKR